MVQTKRIVGINALRQKAAYHIRDPEKEAESLRKERETGCSGRAWILQGHVCRRGEEFGFYYK